MEILNLKFFWTSPISPRSNCVAVDTYVNIYVCICVPIYIHTRLPRSAFARETNSAVGFGHCHVLYHRRNVRIFCCESMLIAGCHNLSTRRESPHCDGLHGYTHDRDSQRDILATRKSSTSRSHFNAATSGEDYRAYNCFRARYTLAHLLFATLLDYFQHK